MSVGITTFQKRTFDLLINFKKEQFVYSKEQIRSNDWLKS